LCEYEFQQLEIDRLLSGILIFEERGCCRLSKNCLPQAYTSVGINMDISQMRQECARRSEEAVMARVLGSLCFRRFVGFTKGFLNPLGECSIIIRPQLGTMLAHDKFDGFVSLRRASCVLRLIPFMAWLSNIGSATAKGSKVIPNIDRARGRQLWWHREV
jgi:hypothetical protein